MDVSRTRALRGPNLWSRHMAIEAVVTCAENERAVGQMAGFEARLRALFPAIGALHPETGGGDVSLAHVLQTAALALQAQAGCPVTFARTTATTDAGVYQVVVEYSEEAVGRKAFEYAQQLIEAALGNGSFDANAVIAELRELDEDERLGPSTGSIVDAAVARGIPYRRLTRGSLVQFGWGSRQRRIQAAEIDTTSAVAESVSAVARIPEVRTYMKALTRSLVANSALPGVVVEGRDITTVVAPDAEIKILLTASEEVRLKRRSAELSEATAASVKRQVSERDASDSKVVDFMTPAPGVQLVDSSDLNFEQTVSAVVSLIEQSGSTKESK